MREFLNSGEIGNIELNDVVNGGLLEDFGYGAV